jgi:hypothetical protein
MDSIPANQIVLQHEETTMEAQHDDIKETNELLSTTNYLSSPSDWKRRITTDGTAIWEEEEMLQHFPLSVVRKIRLSWVRSTFEWFKLELQKQQEGDQTLSDAMLEKLYHDYLAYFRQLAQVMLMNQREKDLNKAIQKCQILLNRAAKHEKEPRSEEEALLAVMPVASSHPTEGSSLVYHLLRERPHSLLSLLYYR